MRPRNVPMDRPPCRIHGCRDREILNDSADAKTVTHYFCHTGRSTDTVGSDDSHWTSAVKGRSPAADSAKDRRFEFDSFTRQISRAFDQQQTS